MQRLRTTTFATTALLLAGCGGQSGMMPTPSAEATRQWNTARVTAMTGLAADQLRDGAFDKCQATLDQALRLTPDDVKLHLLAAKLSIEQGVLERADAHLAAARKLDPSRAEAAYLTGVLMERWQQPMRALVAYSDASIKDPDEVAYVLAQAEILVGMKKPANALDLLQAKLAKFQNNGVMRQEIGLLQAALGRKAEAIASLREACRLTPDDPTAREHLGFTLFADRQFADAADVLDRLVRQTEYAQRADVFAALGESLARTQRPGEAQKAYETAARLDPSLLGYWLGLTRTALEAGDLSAADAAVRKAVALRPGDNNTQCLVGYVRMKQNLLQQALIAFRTASDADPKDGVSVCMQGYVLARMGRTAAARQCYTRAIALQPGSALAGHLVADIGLLD